MWQINDERFETLNELIEFVDSNAFLDFTKNEFKKGIQGYAPQILFCVINTDKPRYYAHLTIADNNPSIWIGYDDVIHYNGKDDLYKYGLYIIIEQIDNRLCQIYPEYAEKFEDSKKENNQENLPF